MRSGLTRSSGAGWLILALILTGWNPATRAEPSANLKMGNPSLARADPSSKDNFLLDRPYFATSYNNSKGTPNWVSWRLSRADLGKAPRDNFYADPDLPPGFLAVTPAEYSGSGFDRGHLCPHGDRTITDEASLATFAMTNIIPQSHDVNTMAWEAFESYCRDLARSQGKVCYIIAGPSGQGGVGKNGPRRTTPDGKVVIPNQNWKVAMILDADVTAARDLTTTSNIRLIAVIMPNVDGRVGRDWTPFQTTVNQVEALTGYTFFSDVDPAVISPLKGETTPAARENIVPDRVFARFGPPVGGDGVFMMPVPMESDAASLAPSSPKEPELVPDTPTMTMLRKAAEGLTYPSESDAPLEVMTWGDAHGALTDAQLWHLSGQDTKARIERIDPARFFDRLMHPQHAHSQVSPEQAQRFQTLFQTLKDELTDLEVIKVGQNEVAIHIIGRTKDGKLICLRTAATET